MKIIVTGGCGFIGSSFVHLLENNNLDYLIIDKMTYASNIDNIPNKQKLLVKDISDVTESDLNGCDYLVNFAAETHVDNSISNGLPFINSNIVGVYNLLELTRKIPNFKKFVQISTDEVYGDLYGSKTLESDEHHPINPSSYYSASKSAADGLVLSAERTFGLPILITRTCNNFGKHQNKEKFLPKMIECIKNGIEIPVYGDGGQIREWIWVEDNVKMIFELMLNETGIWNIGSGDRHTNMNILSLIEKITGNKVIYKNVTDRLGHDRKYALNSDKLIYKYGYKYITKELEEFLKEMF